MSAATRKFINRISKLFGKNSKTIIKASEEWENLLKDLAESQRSLSENFGKLKITKIEEKLKIGNINGSEFSKNIRLGNSIPTYERAANIKIPTSARSAFTSMDKIAKNDFPDAIVEIRNTYGRTNRRRLIEKGIIKDNDVIIDGDKLYEIIKKDPELFSKASKFDSYVRKFKKIIILGTVITVSVFGIIALCQLFAKIAKEHTGCFMYTYGNEKIIKCKIIGCSCNSAELNSTKCLESILPDNMKEANTSCKKGDDEYCVHCDYDEEDESSINYVDKENMPDNTIVKCEKKDGLDMFIEAIGGTIDNGWNKGGEIIGGISDSSTDIISFIPTIIIGIIGIILLIFVFNLIKSFSGIGSGGDGDEGGGKVGGGIHSRLD